VQFSQSLMHFVPLPNIFVYHSVLEHPQSMQFSQRERPISYSYKMTGRTDFVYFNIKLNITTKCKLARSHGETFYIVQQIFQKNWRHLNIVDARQGTGSKIHAKDPQIVGFTIPNKVAWDLYSPVRNENFISSVDCAGGSLCDFALGLLIAGRVCSKTVPQGQRLHRQNGTDRQRVNSS